MDKFLATTIKTANEVYDAVAKARKEGYAEGFEDGRRHESELFTGGWKGNE